MDSDEQLNHLTEAFKRSTEDAEHLMRSFKLSLYARIKLFCHTCMNNNKKVAEIILRAGFQRRSNAGEIASKEIIEYMKRIDDSERHLSGYISNLNIKNDGDVKSPASTVFISHDFARLKRVSILVDGMEIELYLLDPSFLLEQRVDVNVWINGGIPLLHIALEMSDPAVVELLLSRGADPNMLDDHGSNALHAAAKSRARGMIEMLVSYGADIHCVNEFGATPLHALAAMGFERGVELLLANGAKVDVADKTGDTPLHKASNGRPEIVELLLRHGAPVNVINEEGNTPLHKASNGRPEIVKLLLRYGAPVNVINEEGNTPLHNASKNGQAEITELLLRHGARVNDINKDGLTPLLLAAINLKITLETRKKVESIIEILLKHDANINHADLHGRTALHYLAGKGFERGVELLLAKDASVDSEDSDGWTSLHHAAGTCSPKVVELLLRHDAKVDSRTKDGRTPLICAILCRNPYCLSGAQTLHKDVFDHLLNCGADPEAYGKSALLCATLSYSTLSYRRILGGMGHNNYKFTEVGLYMVRRLLEYGAKTSALVSPIPSYLGLFNYDLRILKVTLEYGLVRDLLVMTKMIAQAEMPMRAVENIVKEHVVKLRTAGLILATDGYLEHSDLLKTLEEYSPPDLVIACKAEVVRMEAKIPGADLTFLDVLFMSDDQLARIASNDDVIEAFSEVEEAFRIYGTMLTGRMMRGKVRRRLVQEACSICQPLFNWQLRHVKPLHQVPSEITEQVITYFRDVELKRIEIGNEHDPICFPRLIGDANQHK